MPDRRYRVLLLCSHPVQYSSPVFRQMAQHPELDIQVAYCSLQGSEAGAGLDPEFGVQVKWDLPLLEGYPWVLVPNRAPRPGIGRFLGLVNPGLWKLIAQGRFDAIVAFIGYGYLSAWIAFFSAKLHGTPLLLTADGVTTAARDQKTWKRLLKCTVLPHVFQLMDVVVASSSATVEFVRTLGTAPERIILARAAVDNDYWIRAAGQVDRQSVRASWGMDDPRSVVLFCAKLQPWKRPQDLLRAFARAQMPGSYLVYAGEGPMRNELEAEAAALGISHRVRFLGFVNQSLLPAVYCASDLLVLPSEYEPFGLVVNEAMLCGCVPAVSDQVGAGFDLITPEKNGLRFTCGDIDELAGLLKSVLTDPAKLAGMREAAKDRMNAWSPQESIRVLLEAIERAVQLHPAHGSVI